MRMVFLPFEESSFATFARSASGLFLSVKMLSTLLVFVLHFITSLSFKSNLITTKVSFSRTLTFSFFFLITENHPDRKRKLGTCLTEALKLVLLIGLNSFAFSFFSFFLILSLFSSSLFV